MRLRIGYLDCFSGAAGDMLVGACLDAGVPAGALEEDLGRLGLPGYEVRVEKVRRQSIAGTRFAVVTGGHEPGDDAHSHSDRAQPHRHLADIERILRAAAFPAGPTERMLEAFRLLAGAEAKAHDMPVEDVHFHEVGAVDAIVDICGAVLAFHRLGLARIYCSEVVVGTGTVDCAHGRMPVPAPGTLGLLEGMPIRAGTLSGERCTPTGAALLRVLVDAFAEPVSFRPIAVGYGAGTRDDGPVPNLLRLTVGEVDDAGGADAVWELSLQIDNVSGEVLGHALRAALERGALDAWASPALTKKNRPAHWVVALADDAHRVAVEDCFLTELPTLGLRRHRVERRTLPRRIEERDTPLGKLCFKVRTLPDGTELAHPESDDVERLAREHGLPVPAVLARLGAET